MFCESARIGVMRLYPLILCSLFSSPDIYSAKSKPRSPVTDSVGKKNNLQQVFARTVAVKVPFEQSILTDVPVDSLGS